MSGAGEEGVRASSAPATTVADRKPRHWWRWLAGSVLALLMLAAAGIGLLDSDIGHRFVADRIGALRPANGLRYSVGRISGSLFSKAMLVDIRVRDPKGVVFSAPRAMLDWNPLAWASNRLHINRLTVPVADLERLPEPVRTGRQGPILPGFDIHVGALDIGKFHLAAAVAGKPRLARVHAGADVHAGRAMVTVDAVVAGSDRLHFQLDAAPDADRFRLQGVAQGMAGGVLAKLSGLRQSVALTVAGKGGWRRWQGNAHADVGGVPIVDLALANRAGSFSLGGTAWLASLARGKLAALTAPRVQLQAQAVLADRVLEGTASARSAALEVTATGALDLGRSAFRKLLVAARLRQPQALFPNMTGRGIGLRALLDGAFGSAAFDYRLAAERVAFGATGFEEVRASGQGRFSAAPVRVPVALRAARVTGVGDVAGGILRALAVDGVLQVSPTAIVGDALGLRSDRLSGTATVLLDLRTGHYDVALNGGLGRYLIAGLGLVDVSTRLSVVPGPGGKGARVVGTGTARMLRLDNGFLASLAEGLPQITTGLERTPDGLLNLRNLVLTAPGIRLTGNGVRRRDGTFQFAGTGSHRVYGPLSLKLDGRIERPTLDLVFARPNAALDLRQVAAHLDPTSQGFRFSARGGSLLGDFAGNGQIILQPEQNTTIAIAALDIGGVKGSGTLRAVTGGFDGVVQVAGGGVSGVLRFAPAGKIQRVEAHLDADRARVLGDAVLRRGHLDATALLDPAGATVEAQWQGAGLRRGVLSLARFTGSASLRGGTGRVQFAIAGTRGRAFDIRADADVTPERYRIMAAGTIDRRDIRLTAPAIVTPEGNGWRLAPASIAFAGGAADIGGRVDAESGAVDATLRAMPLAVLDIAYPGLGLSGSASGKLSYAQRVGSAPTGRLDLTVRGVSRAGLVHASQPVDLGLAAALTAEGAALRAVMASGGKTIGRAQAKLAPLGSGSLGDRLANAGVFAQVRYDGPADTLWRLTGVELFDLSGPVAIGADIGGKVNDPRLRGVLRASGARIEGATTGTVLTGVEALGSFSGSKLAITSFAADAGKGGRVTGTGSFDFAAVNGFGIDLALQATNAVMINRDDIAATVTGPLTIRSSGSGGVIAGQVQLTGGRYRLGQAGAASSIPRLAVREINLAGGDEDASGDTPLAPWRLDLNARAVRGLTVTGLGLSSEWSTDVHIGGAPDSPIITGRADLVRGVYEFSGREFTLDRGVIRFAGEVPANPSLDIAANADATGLSASIRVTGPAQKPEISFASTPALPQDELLSRLLFGTSITKLSAPEALQLAGAVASLNSTGGGLNPINALRRVAGLDRLRILPADTVVGRTTSVAAGKFITRRLYAEIVTDGAGYSATQIEFQVTRWLSILSTISTIGRQSVNVRVSKDY